MTGLVLLQLCSCAQYYKPTMIADTDPIREFSSGNSVRLVNGQPSSTKVRSMGSRSVNLRECTDVAVRITDRELTRRGLSMRNDASKSLILSVESAKSVTGFVEISSDVVMRVKTSSGYSAVYTGTDKSYMAGRPDAQLDTGLMRAVVEMLNDPKIVAFLTK